MKIAVITGASSGMGREFVTRLDKAEKFDELWLIARRRERLEELRPLVRASLRVIPLDLTDRSSVARYEEELLSSKPEVHVLVNAAGYGKFHSLEDTDRADVNGMIELNCRALADMIKATLPYMPDHRGARIYNLGSMSSVQPVPYMNVYAASKAFVLSLSRSLNVELKPRGIKCMAVCPYWVDTEFFDRARDDNTVSNFSRVYSPEKVVRTALGDMKRGRDVSVCGLPVKLQWLGVKLMPHRLVMKIWLKQQNIR